jgi:hypothetical protein
LNADLLIELDVEDGNEPLSNAEMLDLVLRQTAKPRGVSTTVVVPKRGEGCKDNLNCLSSVITSYTMMGQKRSTWCNHSPFIGFQWDTMTVLETMKLFIIR